MTPKVSQLDFRPFRAWRYQTKKVVLNRVIAPPYDVISSEERDRLYDASPFNVVRLILGKETNFYQHARQCWEEWTREGILVQDEHPAFYLYEQVFKHPWDSHPMRRHAVVGILKLEAGAPMLLHEATFLGPKRDRFRLLEMTRTSLSPIFGLYRDSKKVLSQMALAYQSRPSLFQASEDQGVTHRGWAIEREEDQREIHEAVAGGKILIADGHHRYETALEYQRKMRERFPSAGPEAPFDFVMMALVEFEDEGLLVLPTHRIVRSLGTCSKEEFLGRLRVYFDLRPTPEEKLFSELHRQPCGERVFGAAFGEAGSFLLRLKSLAAIRESLPGGKPAVWYEIDSNLLTHFIFGALGGLSKEELQDSVEYTRFWEEAIQAVREERAAAAFFLRAPGVETIRKLAELEERVPQKTTYFYPKLASGLLFYHHGN